MWNATLSLSLYISTLFISFLTSSLWGIPPFQTVSKKIQILMSWRIILYCLKPNFDYRARIAFFLHAGLKVLKMKRHSTWRAFFPSLIPSKIWNLKKDPRQIDWTNSIRVIRPKWRLWLLGDTFVRFNLEQFYLKILKNKINNFFLKKFYYKLSYNNFLKMHMC